MRAPAGLLTVGAARGDEVITWPTRSRRSAISYTEVAPVRRVAVRRSTVTAAFGRR
jgi:hypothetical protein